VEITADAVREVRLAPAGGRAGMNRNEDQPMKRKPWRAPLLALATVLFLAISLQPSPSDTAIPDPMRSPAPFDESFLRRDLADWMLSSSRPPERHLVSSEDLAIAMGTSPRHFGLFQPDVETARRAYLSTLPFGSLLQQVAERNRVDGLLVASVVEAESGFAPAVISSEGAVGLMQILPSTGHGYKVADLLDPRVNLSVGSRYLGGLLTRFGGNLELALAAYNAGPEVVVRYGRVPPYRETRSFVNRVLSLYEDHKLVAQRLALPSADPFAAPEVRRGP
jgi:soluble lytic murein transglycosylase-like protein